MFSAAFRVSAAELTMSAGQWREPVAIIDLDAESGDVPDMNLPACPVVGIGSPDHPLGHRMDTIVEPHFDGAAMTEAASRHPVAAACVAQLLRLLPALSREQGLTAESFAYAMLQGSEAHRAWIAASPSPDPLPEGHVEVAREGDELYVTLDRPAAGNAIDRPMRDGLHEAFALASADASITRVVLRGNGKTFSLGADLSEFGTTTDPATAHMIRFATLPAREAVRCADRLEAHVDGACVGAGLELAAFARRITASRRSWFQLPELAMGILPGAGGCVSLTHRIGRQRTLLMILSGRRIAARQALDWGLVDALVDAAP
ncbi:enoyl-CoA hydratase/isomerase family protein [Novosphingobium mangrovi (ex Huang et al. 2023)]|uniref:Enoyl-CoA hydratase/isomerase family protein n=1 Tax=Novosphingobium mangrovi (ex Huang et al. 2023) TaxID=2976432 RepID=A0ABT2I7M3_9SPHN|nr:enoyl-CoA hydratase/isomerase family protein [Novosphingobium mangrovi (ex Huang et al. 2023)]MCT2400806.1 enoyl-CoA hydratase/isomerase family protein [Novosphingobium mangrovi (ex Huang et al. 2023)]